MHVLGQEIHKNAPSQGPRLVSHLEASAGDQLQLISLGKPVAASQTRAYISPTSRSELVDSGMLVKLTKLAYQALAGYFQLLLCP